ncbi:hypothetical protein [Kitasatospora sp. LaBMicrA B282]|uniref:hypothetical protein n=1 Tax=Kitasatospora sp. LaBMicrA B282 TaxID=3420949 RepID=UPI003D104468
MQSSRQTSHRSTTRIGGVVAPVVLIAALGGSLTGCGGKVTTDVHSYQVADRISTLTVRTPGGTVQVLAGNGPAVEVKETVRYDGAKPQVDHTTADGALSLTAAECASSVTHQVCQVDYRVEVPKDVAVTVRNTGGGVTVTGLAGALDLIGDGGAVQLSGVTSKQVTARSDGAGVNAQFAAAPDLVDLHSAGGNVLTQLPDGVYAVDASADGSSPQVRVRTDPAAPHKVTVHSDGGDVSVLPAG